MSKSEPQGLKNHGRFDPPYHFFLTFVSMATIVIAVIYCVHHFCFYSVWLVVLSLAAFVALFRMRQYPLKVQDRVIRLEERLRLQALAPAEWHTQIYRLTEDQLIALRRQNQQADAAAPIAAGVDSVPAIRRIQAMLAMVDSGAEINLIHVGKRPPDLVDENGVALDLPILLRDGAVVETILAVAGELDVDAIAMPTAGRHGLLDAVRGSASARVLEDARWPLLAVPVG